MHFEDQSTRRESRIADSAEGRFFFYSNSNEETNNILFLSKFINEISNELLGNDIGSKAECLKKFEQLIKTSPKYLLPKITDQILTEICKFIDDPSLSCVMFRFLSSLIQVNSSFIDLLVKNQIYEKTVLKIEPKVNPSFYRYALLFISTSVQKRSNIITYFQNIDLLNRLFEMNQAEYIDLLLSIYLAGIVVLHNIHPLAFIFNYFTYSKDSVILKSLNCLRNCLNSINDFDDFWTFIIFEPRMIALLSKPNPTIIASSIEIYSLICKYGDSSISQLFANKEIIQIICKQIFEENEEIHSSVLNFILSLTDFSINNINNVYELINLLNLSQRITFYSFTDQQKVAMVYLKLIMKISGQQIIFTYNSELLNKMAEISVADEEMKQFCSKVFTEIISKHSQNDEIIQLVQEVMNDNDLFEF